MSSLSVLPTVEFMRSLEFMEHSVPPLASLYSHEQIAMTESPILLSLLQMSFFHIKKLRPRARQGPLPTTSSLAPFPPPHCFLTPYGDHVLVEQTLRTFVPKLVAELKLLETGPLLCCLMMLYQV